MDRTYWRFEPTSRLISEARTKGCELCFVLSERLEDAEYANSVDLDEALERVKDLQLDCNQLDDKVYELRVEIDKLNLMIGQREDRIAELEAALKKGKN
jgi:peptidoglycan hydrolase CwlO-like protein